MDEPDKTIVAIHQLAVALAVMRDPQGMMALAAHHVRDLLHAEAVAIFVWDAAAGKLMPAFAEPAGTHVGGVASASGAVGRAFNQRRPIVIDDHPSASDAPVWDARLELGALAAAPLIIAGEGVGVLLASRFQPCPFTEAQVDLLATLGTLAVASTLSRAYLESRIRELELRANLLHAQARGAASDIPQLTRREREVLPLLAQGHTNREIGATLRVSSGTARNLVARLQSKLGARDRTHAVVIAIAHGLMQA